MDDIVSPDRTDPREETQLSRIEKTLSALDEMPDALRAEILAEVEQLIDNATAR